MFSRNIFHDFFSDRIQEKCCLTNNCKTIETGSALITSFGLNIKIFQSDYGDGVNPAYYA
ncbi:hypothetical protein MYP_3985 [Sporocytophaga myxococcoides]|uniref:Uncharacterized protein n=1 Tax=Sporocytophaga myxococcoides TaxID=153721 RepID=A0A098LIJ8_9BACT|nr:hypothetical protein MYP_3985 [Sporocytophaga myxococcoides]